MMKRLILGALVMSSGVSAMPGMGNGNASMDGLKGNNPHGAVPMEDAVLVGKLTSQQLIFEMIPMGREYLAYKVNTEALSPLVKREDKVEILAVLGTWDKVSQQQVPRMMKILKILDNPNITADYVGVDKKGSAGETPLMEGIQVIAFPTFIVRQGGKEIGRIEGQTPQGLETELAQLLR
ncbi:thioredoxin family protein [Ferrimonas kyonanensis]|uniref:thioredoxin family protein n=1 Tax=Ferrimonas kyonanensis TaxID=364763 RepID=UPI0003FB02E5|nr:thioredoxin family protein [Ferrimonas kyonanensis]